MARRSLISLFGLALLAGCATVPPSGPSFPSALASQRVFLDNTPYLPFSAILREIRGQEQWDPQTQIGYLTAGGHELRLASQIPVVLVDGAVYSLPMPPRMERGRLLVPETVWTQWLSRWWTPAAPAPRFPEARIRTVVIDAGHGGHDPGATGRGGLKEKNVTLDIARRLRDLLVRDGFHVVMTRYDDRFVPLYGRSTLANREGADLFLSIHANASRFRQVSGFEAYYLSEATDDHSRAIEAAENSSLPEEVGRPISSASEAILWDLLYTEHRMESLELASYTCRGLSGQGKNRGVKSARFAVLKGARMPAVLIEVGFISNPTQESQLRQTSFRQRLAEGIRQGIVAFRTQQERKYAHAP